MDPTRGADETQLLTPQLLRAVELGKHKALLAAIMRIAARKAVPDYYRALTIPYRLLSEVEALAPKIATDVVAAPQFGAWANDVLRRLLDDENPLDTAPADDREPVPDGVPLSVDLGHLALFAATAAVRAGYRFDLEIPLRDGATCFPALGTVRAGSGSPWEWGQARLDATGCHVQTLTATVDVPGTPGSSGTGWVGFPRVTATDGGTSLDVVLDDGDPFLDRYGSARIRIADDDLPRWRHLIAAGWQILAADHQPLAALVSGTVRTVVPLASPGPTRTASSTEEASFGAIALALPADALGMAEVLVHETQHAVLGALVDIEPLVRDGASDGGQPGFLAYAPWRDDPRPAHALLQGIYAHYGIGRFWRRQYVAGPADQRERAAAQFGRIRTMTGRAIRTLAGSGLVTDAGRDLLAGIQREVTAWLDEPLPAVALQHVADLATDHEARWRVAHLQPDPAAVGALADAWRGGGPPPLRPDDVPVRVRPGPLPAAAGNMRFYLLTLRYGWPELLDEPDEGPLDGWSLDSADAELIRGNYETAAEGYLRRIAAGEDRDDAWAGLAVARRRTCPYSGATLLAERTELIASLHALVSAGSAVREDLALPDRLAHWLMGTR
jgi:HEXXH motif-containing protein